MIVNDESPDIEIVVVGNKTDITRDVSEKDAQCLAVEINAKYVESSAKTGQGIELIYNNIFQVLPDIHKRKGQTLSIPGKINKRCGCL